MDRRSDMKVPRYRLLLWAAFLVAALFFVVQMGFLPGGGQMSRPKGFDLLDSLFQLIRNDYLEEPDPLRVADGAYRGLVNSLDPLSAYLDADMTAKLTARTERETDPGLIVYKRYGAFPEVAAVVEGSPADKAGLRSGDLLSAIEGRSTVGMSQTEIGLLLRGGDESAVKVRLMRGNETTDLELARTVLFPRAYEVRRPAGGAAVVGVRRFLPGLAASLRGELSALAKKDPNTPLVVDLRYARGGDFEEARAFANLFVRAVEAGWFEKRGGEKEPFSCPSVPAIPAGPLVVWTSEGTMGAAELVAGLLQELRKAQVVGRPTLGLAGRTDHIVLKDGSSVLLTSAVYVLPSGRKLWQEGVRPDIVLPAGRLLESAYLEKTGPLLPKR